MPIEMYGERGRRDLQARRRNVRYTAGLGRAQGIIMMAFELFIA